MIEREQIRNIVLRAMDQVKELSLDEQGLSSEESTVLFGEGAVLDSMSFVNFVAALEEEMSEVSENSVDVVEMLNSSELQAAPIRTIGHLVDLLHRSLLRSTLS